jgi:hypothetical protein
MSLLARVDQWSLRLADRLDPMLVRCVRQDLRSKVFVGVFSLLLLISTVAALIFATQAGAASAKAETPYGKYLFIALGWCWSFALIVVQSSATNRLVAQERQDDTWDLLELTGLSPQRMVRGLLLASLTQSALYTAAMTPFLAMAYLLRGLDLLTIVAALVIVPMLGVLAAAVALLFAAAAPSKKARMAGGGLIGLLMFVGWAVTASWQFNAFDRGFGTVVHGVVSGEKDALIGAGIYLTAWASLLWLCLVFSATLLTHRAADRSSRPRAAVAIVWGLAIVWMVGILLWAGQSRSQREELLAAMGFVGVLLTLVAGFFTFSEDYALTPRQAQTIAGAHGWRRRAMLLLGPGAARGRWYTLALAASALAMLVPAYVLSSREPRPALLGWIALGQGLLVLLVIDACARHLFGRWCSGPLPRRVAMLAVLAVWVILPPLAAMVVGEDNAAYPFLRWLTPGWGVTYHALEQHGQELGGLDGLALLLPLPMLALVALQARRLTVVTRRVVAEIGDRNARA